MIYIVKNKKGQLD